MIVYYHNACPDGFTAAWVAKRKYPDAELIALNHGLTANDINILIINAVGEDVLMLDYSLPTREANDKLAAAAKSFLILDHHKSAREVLDGAPYAVFDMDRSGAGLAWDYLFGKDSTGEWTRDREEREGGVDIGSPRPWFIDYVEARDLWRWDSVPNAREVCAYLGSLPFEIETYNKLLHFTVEDALVLGRGAQAHIDHIVRETVKNARPGRLAGHDVLVLNTTYLNCSEIGNELAKSADFSITWFERKDDVIQFSLRSIGDFDVSAIAKSFNGGGHKNAAGFQLSILQGRSLVDTILDRRWEWPDGWVH